jgi:hypothetical protein
MDGDDVIRSLAEAVEGDALFSHSLASGHSIPAGTVTGIGWAVPSENECALAKLNLYQWQVTVPGLYVVTVATSLSPSQTGRAFTDLYVGPHIARGVFTGDSKAAATIATRCVAGAVIKAEIYCTTATSISAGVGGAYLNVSRLGRSANTTPPT